MTKLPGAKPSPRIAGGVLRWYAGDTFSVTLALELRDQDGDPVTVGELVQNRQAGVWAVLAQQRKDLAQDGKSQR